MFKENKPSFSRGDRIEKFRANIRRDTLEQRFQQERTMMVEKRDLNIL